MPALLTLVVMSWVLFLLFAETPAKWSGVKRPLVSRLAHTYSAASLPAFSSQ